MNWLETTSAWLADSSIRESVLYLLMNVPGLPPIVQTLHLAAIAVLMASVVMVALRLLGMAAPSQRPAEMIPRLMPWMWWALLMLLLSGAVFVIARPDRYFANPIAGWKVALLIPLVLVCLLIHVPTISQPGYWQRTVWRSRWAGALSVMLLTLLVGVIFAGRWIAYVDYIYWE